MLGSHTASATGICSANADDTVWNIMYEKLSARPTPSDSPIPPLRLREDSDAPIIVNINAAKDIAMRLWLSDKFVSPFQHL